MKHRIWIGAAAPLLFTVVAGAGTAVATPDTVKVELRQIATVMPAEALVEAVHQASIEAQVGGRITKLPFDVGRSVRRGQVLVRLEDRQSDAALAGTKAQYERARRVREINPDALSPAALDQARAAYETALGARTLVAPFDGVIGRLDVAVGDAATPGKALLMLYDPSRLRLIVDIPLNRLDAIQAEPVAQVELPGSKRIIESRHMEFLPATDPRTQSVRVRIALPGEAGGIRPGSFARVRFAGETTPTLVIAKDAVLRRGEITAAYVLRTDGSRALRQIRIGHAVDAQNVEVLVGLKAGETVLRQPLRAAVVSPPP